MGSEGAAAAAGEGAGGAAAEWRKTLPESKPPKNPPRVGRAAAAQTRPLSMPVVLSELLGGKKEEGA